MPGAKALTRMPPCQLLILPPRSGQLFAPVIPPGSLRVAPDAPIVREVVEDWLRERGGHLRGEQFLAQNGRRLEFDGQTAPCLAQ